MDHDAQLYDGTNFLSTHQKTDKNTPDEHTIWATSLVLCERITPISIYLHYSSHLPNGLWGCLSYMQELNKGNFGLEHIEGVSWLLCLTIPIYLLANCPCNLSIWCMYNFFSFWVWWKKFGVLAHTNKHKHSHTHFLWYPFISFACFLHIFFFLFSWLSLCMADVMLDVVANLWSFTTFLFIMPAQSPIKKLFGPYVFICWNATIIASMCLSGMLWRRPDPPDPPRLWVCYGHSREWIGNKHKYRLNSGSWGGDIWSLSLPADWLINFSIFKGCWKDFLVLVPVSQHGGADGIYGPNSMVWASADQEQYGLVRTKQQGVYQNFHHKWPVTGLVSSHPQFSETPSQKPSFDIVSPLAQNLCDWGLCFQSWENLHPVHGYSWFSSRLLSDPHGWTLPDWGDVHHCFFWLLLALDATLFLSSCPSVVSL